MESKIIVILEAIEAQQPEKMMSRHTHPTIDNNKQTPRYCPPFPPSRRTKSKSGACLEEGGKDCASQAEAESGLHHTSSGAGRGCWACASRAPSSPSRWACRSSLCDGTCTGCCCLDGSSGDGGVWDCRRNHHGDGGDGRKRDLNQGCIDASWNSGSDGDNCWLGSDG